MSPRARVGIIIGIFSLFTIVLIVKLFVLSIINHETYLAEAKEQQQVKRDILPRRGTIYVNDTAAGSQVVVAESVERFALSATPRNVENKEDYAKLLAGIAGVDEGELLAKLNKNGLYMDPIMHGLTKEQVEDITHKIVEQERKYYPKQAYRTLNFDQSQGNVLQYLGGVFFVREYERTYPEGGLMGQALGFVNDKGEGMYGIEGQYNQELQGYAGRISLERDSRGVSLQQTEQISGRDGTSYLLTIDRNVQRQVEVELAAEVERSKAKGGSVIVMDPESGDVIAMASVPTYEPEKFRSVPREENWRFDNPAVSAVWEPGSVFKTLIMGAALDQGVVTPQTTEVFGSNVVVDGYTINTALNKAFGKETMTDVLVNSDNVAMVWLGNKMGNALLNDYIRKYGFGTVTGIDLKSEEKGRVVDVKVWSNALRATTTFGQGISTTPIQITSAYTAIANDGIMMKPRMVKGVVNAQGEVVESAVAKGKQVLKPETAMQLREMLQAVVVKAHKRAGVTGYKIGGKTGTAQVPDPEKPGYIPNVYNHSFVGMAPIDDPEYVMLVKVDQPDTAVVGEFAEGTAVPLFGSLSRFLLHYYQIPPGN